jgi:mRNA interferase RelE/StbE
MNIIIDRSFERDTNKIKDKKILLQIASCIIAVRNCNSAIEIKGIKRLKGAPHHFRIKIGYYRAGVIINDCDIVFERFLHRNDIYKYFPKS